MCKFIILFIIQWFILFIIVQKMIYYQILYDKSLTFHKEQRVCESEQTENSSDGLCIVSHDTLFLSLL